jgi:L-cysteine:1D-myo-inositol 2-amino-2-deoxy-alpha-D-glucopyranoside ligase
VRLALAAQHYRTPWEWHDGLLDDATRRLARWDGAQGDARPGVDPGLAGEVGAALDDDLDTPAAVALLDEAATKGLDVTHAARLVGLDLLAARRRPETSP